MNVLTPQQRNSVVTLLQNKVSQHQIKRKTGIDRKTIRKLAQEISAALAGASNSSSPATGSPGLADQIPPPRPPAAVEAQPSTLPAHARSACESHRNIFEASDIDPQRAGQALDMIGGLYAIEATIREQQLTGEAKRAVRQAQARPVVENFFDWIDKQFEAQGLLPSNPLLGALAYARDRREGLMVYLGDPEVPIDTNHLERALRVIPMGRKNWLFAWTELGAKHVGIVQSLLVTCRLHEIDPYDYFVDVLQRVGGHPSSAVEQLTPRRWKERFAHQPLRSDLYDLTARHNHSAG